MVRYVRVDAEIQEAKFTFEIRRNQPTSGAEDEGQILTEFGKYLRHIRHANK